jgi:hypothetical protein
VNQTTNVLVAYVRYVTVCPTAIVYVVRYVLIEYVSTKINNVLTTVTAIRDWVYVRYIAVYGRLRVCHVNHVENVMVLTVLTTYVELVKVNMVNDVLIIWTVITVWYVVKTTVFLRTDYNLC